MLHAGVRAARSSSGRFSALPACEARSIRDADDSSSQGKGRGYVQSMYVEYDEGGHVVEATVSRCWVHRGDYESKIF